MRNPPTIPLRPTRLLRHELKAPSRLPASSAVWLAQHARHLANVRDEKPFQHIYLRSGRALSSSNLPNPGQPMPNAGAGGSNNERTVKLGKTVRILHERLPNLLASPLPQDILSPQIKLELFPSTHPHLPTVTGKIAYSAALWTAPVAWGRVPVVGNVKLLVLSERMLKNGVNNLGGIPHGNENLIVRWRTCGKTKRGSTTATIGNSGQVDKITELLGGVESLREGPDQEFSGLFIFSFDEEGRILNHTIEHAEQGGNWEKMTSKVVNVTDWLLGRAKWKRIGDQEEGLALGYGYCEVEETDIRRKWQQHRDRRYDAR